MLLSGHTVFFDMDLSDTLGLIFLAIIYILGILMCYQESKIRDISFISALAICLILSPIIGYFIISNRPLRNPRGCNWCGNKENEAEYCGVCGKNEAGEIFVKD